MDGRKVPFRDYPLPLFRVRCRPCGRLGEYRTAKIIERYGADYAIADFIESVVVNCPHGPASALCNAGCEEMPMIIAKLPSSASMLQNIRRDMERRIAELDAGGVTSHDRTISSRAAVPLPPEIE